MVGLPLSKRTGQAGGYLFSYFDVVVRGVLKGDAPSRITIRVDGGRLPDGTWQDYESFTLDVGRQVILPLHAFGGTFGIGPAEPGVYYLDQQVLGHVLQAGALQPAEAGFPTFPGCSSAACTENVEAKAALSSDMTDEIADVYATVDDTLAAGLETATLPALSACGVTKAVLSSSSTPAGSTATVAAEASCYATASMGAAQTGQYDAKGALGT